MPLLCMVLFALASCNSEEPEVPVVKNVDTAVLVYAVASNDLYSNLVDDKSEMLKGASNLDLDHLTWMVYEVTPGSQTARLSKIVKLADGTCAFEDVKTYDRSLYSTDPARMSEVIDDFCSAQPSTKYGLVLWSHGTGFEPSFSNHQTVRNEIFSNEGRMVYSFGADNDGDKDGSYTDRMDITEFATAIPDNRFDFIWFDVCYMSSIETAYELKDKCKRLVAYPTEVFSPGMPYDLTVPYILRSQPDLVGGAKAFFDYYAQSPSSSMRVATVAVMDMNAIDEVAEACKGIWPGSEDVSKAGLQIYSRGRLGPFYDFGQVTRRMAAENELEVSRFDQAMSDFIVWKGATPRDFAGNVIDPQIYSGVSCHLYDPASQSDKNLFYKTLGWYKAVYN